MDIAAELFKAYGPPGLVCVILYVALFKSEQREAKKDIRIQLLENKLTESYDERIAAADRIADGLHASTRATENMIIEFRARK